MNPLSPHAFWKKCVALGLVFSLLSTTITVEMAHAAREGIFDSFLIAQTTTRSATPQVQSKPEAQPATNKKPSGPQCVESLDLKKLITRSVQKVEEEVHKEKTKLALESKGQAPKELLEVIQKKHVVLTFTKNFSSDVIVSAVAQLKKNSCERQKGSAMSQDKGKQELERVKNMFLNNGGVVREQIQMTTNNDGVQFEVKKRGKVFRFHLCADGQLQTADGTITLSSDQKKNSQEIYKMAISETERLKKLLELIPEGNYTKKELSAILKGINSEMGEDVFGIEDFDRIYSRNKGGEIALSKNKIYFIEPPRGGEKAMLYYLDPFDSNTNLVKTWNRTDFDHIQNLPEELRNWAKSFGANNALTASDWKAAGVLSWLSKTFRVQQEESIDTVRKEWTIIQKEQVKVLDTINSTRLAQGKPSIDFLFRPLTQEIKLRSLVDGKGIEINFRHVKHNIYEHIDAKGKRHLVLITGDPTNLRQLGILFDRISNGEPPKTLVDLDDENREVIKAGRVVKDDSSYLDWKYSLSSQKKSKLLRDLAQTQQLRAEFNSQSRAVQLRIQLMGVLQDDIIAFKNEVQNSKLSNVTAYLGQWIRMPLGGGESNFIEQITALSNEFIALYMAVPTGKSKSRLQQLLEDNPRKSLHEILTTKDPKNSSIGLYIRDKAMFDFISRIIISGPSFIPGVGGYSYHDLKTNDDLLERQFEQDKTLSGTFSDDFSPEGKSWTDYPAAPLNALISTVFGKRQYAMMESKIYSEMDDVFNPLIAKSCNSPQQYSDFLAEAKQDVEDQLNQEIPAQKVDELGYKRGPRGKVTYRNYLMLNLDNRISTLDNEVSSGGKDAFEKIVKSMVSARMKLLQQHCARAIMVKNYKNGTLKDIISHPIKRKRIQHWLRVFDYAGEWGTISKQSWNIITEEILINAPLMLLSFGASSVIMKLAASGLAKLGKGIALAGRAYKGYRVVRYTRNIVAATIKAHRAGSLVTRGVQKLGFVGRAALEGALEGVIEQAISGDALKYLVTGRSNTTPNQILDSIMTEAFYEVIFDVTGPLSKALFKTQAKYVTRLGVERSEEISRSVVRAMENSKFGKVASRYMQEKTQQVLTVTTILTMNELLRRFNGETPPPGQDPLKSNAFQQEILQTVMQVWAMAKGRKAADRFTKNHKLLNDFINGNLFGQDADLGKRFSNIESRLGDAEARKLALERSLENLDVNSSEAKNQQTKINDMAEVVENLQGERAQLSLSRIQQLRAELADYDLTISNDGINFADANGLTSKRKAAADNLLRLETEFVDSRLSEFEKSLNEISQTILFLENANKTGELSESQIAGNQKQITDLQNQLVAIGIAKNQFTTNRLNQLRAEKAKTRESIKKYGLEKAGELGLTTQEVNLNNAIKEYEVQRTVVKTEAEYQDIVRKQTGNESFVVIDEYAHINLATGRIFVNQEGLANKAKQLRDEANNMPINALAEKFKQMNDVELANVIAIRGEPDAVRQEIADFRTNLQRNPSIVDQVRNGGSTLRSLYARNQVTNLYKSNVKHEFGHRLGQSLPVALKDGLAKELGFDLTDSKAKERFEEAVADWVSGDLDATTSKKIDDFLRSKIKEFLKSQEEFSGTEPSAELIDKQLNDFKKIKSIREAFNQNYQADVGVDFQRGNVVLPAPQVTGNTERSLKDLQSDFKKRKVSKSPGSQYFSARKVSAYLKSLPVADRRAALVDVLKLMDSEVLQANLSTITNTQKRNKIQLQRKQLDALLNADTNSFGFVRAVINETFERTAGSEVVVTQENGKTTASGLRSIFVDSAEVLGKGTFGTVYRGVRFTPNSDGSLSVTQVALKTFDLSTEYTGKSRSEKKKFDAKRRGVRRGATHEVLMSTYLMQQAGEGYPSGVVRIDSVGAVYNADGVLVRGAIAQELKPGKNLGEENFDSSESAEQRAIEVFENINSLHDMGLVDHDFKPENYQGGVIDPGSWHLSGVPVGHQAPGFTANDVRNTPITEYAFSENGNLLRRPRNTGELTHFGTKQADAEARSVPLEKAAPVLIASPAYAPHAFDASVENIKGKETIVFSTDKVTSKLGKKVLKKSGDYARGVERGAFSKGGFDHYSVAMSFVRMLSSRADLPNLQIRVDGKLSPPPSYDTNFAQQLSPDFAKDLWNLSLDILGVKVFDDGTAVFDHSESQSEASRALFQRAAEILKQTRRGVESEKSLADKSAAEVRELMEDALQEAIDADAAANSAVPARTNYMQAALNFWNTWISTPAVNAKDKLVALLTMKIEAPQAFTDLVTKVKEFRTQQEVLRESSADFESSLPESVTSSMEESASAVESADNLKSAAIVLDYPLPVDPGLSNKGQIEPNTTQEIEVANEVNAASDSLLGRLTQGATASAKQLFKNTFIDPMTGHLNRGGLSFLDGLISEGKRVSVVSYDGDHFGAFNDVLSSQYGDFMIQIMGIEFHNMANKLRSRLAESGLEGRVEVVRMGGEEFVVFAEGVAQSVLKKAMEEMAANLKQRMRDNLTQDQINALGYHAFATKYDPTLGKDPTEITDLDRVEATQAHQRAINEIGGSTAAGLGFDFSLISAAERARLGAAKLRANALQYTDQWLEFGKNKGGRGSVYESANVVNRRSDDTQRLVGFQALNDVSSSQNTALNGIRANLDAKVKSDFEAGLVLKNDAVRRWGLNQSQAEVLNQFLADPSIDENATREMAEKILRIRPNADFDAVVRLLNDLKIEHFTRVRDFGNYTGAATVYHLSNLGPDYGAPVQVDPGEFKSINETMGHTHGDTFLTFFHQNVLKDTARSLGMNVDGPNPDVVFAQKGASFIFRVRKDSPVSAEQFQKAFDSQDVTVNGEADLSSSLFFGKLQDFFGTIGLNEAGEGYDKTRLEWLRENKKKLATDPDPDYLDRFTALFDSNVSLPKPDLPPQMSDFYNAMESAGKMTPELEAAIASGEFTFLNTGATQIYYSESQKLGAGGLGEVFRAYEVNEDGEVTDVALKRNDVQGNIETATREKNAQNNLIILQASEFFNATTNTVRSVSPDGQYVVLELVKNSSGKVELGQQKFGTKEKALRVLLNALQNISRLNKLRFIHGDIKLENIFIDDDGNAILGDNANLTVFGKPDDYQNGFYKAMTVEGNGLFNFINNFGGFPNTPAYSPSKFGLAGAIISDRAVLDARIDAYAAAKIVKFLVSGKDGAGRALESDFSSLISDDIKSKLNSSADSVIKAIDDSVDIYNPKPIDHDTVTKLMSNLILTLQEVSPDTEVRTEGELDQREIEAVGKDQAEGTDRRQKQVKAEKRFLGSLKGFFKTSFASLNFFNWLNVRDAAIDTMEAREETRAIDPEFADKTPEALKEKLDEVQDQINEQGVTPETNWKAYVRAETTDSYLSEVFDDLSQAKEIDSSINKEDWVKDPQNIQKYGVEEAHVTHDGRVVYNQTKLDELAEIDAKRIFDEDPIAGVETLEGAGRRLGIPTRGSLSGLRFDTLRKPQQKVLIDEQRAKVEDRAFTHEHSHLLFRLILGEMEAQASSAIEKTLARQDVIDTFTSWVSKTLNNRASPRNKAIVAKKRAGDPLTSKERAVYNQLVKDAKLLARAGLKGEKLKDLEKRISEGKQIDLETIDEFVAYYADGIRSGEIPRNPIFEQTLNSFFALLPGSKMTIPGKDGKDQTITLTAENFYELAHQGYDFGAARYTTLGRRTRLEGDTTRLVGNIKDLLSGKRQVNLEEVKDAIRALEAGSVDPKLIEDVVQFEKDLLSERNDIDTSPESIKAGISSLSPQQIAGGITSQVWNYLSGPSNPASVQQIIVDETRGESIESKIREAQLQRNIGSGEHVVLLVKRDASAVPGGTELHLSGNTIEAYLSDYENGEHTLDVFITVDKKGSVVKVSQLDFDASLEMKVQIAELNKVIKSQTEYAIADAVDTRLPLINEALARLDNARKTYLSNKLSENNPKDLLGGEGAKFLEYVNQQNGKPTDVVKLLNLTRSQLRSELTAALEGKDPNEIVIVQAVNPSIDEPGGVQISIMVDTVANLKKSYNGLLSYNRIDFASMMFHMQRTFTLNHVTLDLIAFRSDLRGQGFGGPVFTSVQKLISSKLVNPLGNVKSFVVNYLTARELMNRYGAELDLDATIKILDQLGTVQDYLLNLRDLFPQDSSLWRKINNFKFNTDIESTIYSIFQDIEIQALSMGMNSLEYILFQYQVEVESKIQDPEKRLQSYENFFGAMFLNLDGKILTENQDIMMSARDRIKESLVSIDIALKTDLTSQQRQELLTERLRLVNQLADIQRDFRSESLTLRGSADLISASLLGEDGKLNVTNAEEGELITNDQKKTVRATTISAYLSKVYEDEVARGKIDPEVTSEASFIQDNFQTVGAELAHYSQSTGEIVFNSEAVRLQALRNLGLDPNANLSQSQETNVNREIVKLYRELIRHENIHRTFNILSNSPEFSGVLAALTTYVKNLGDFSDQLKPDQQGLLNETAKNLGMAPSELSSRIRNGDNAFIKTVMDEMFATYYGMREGGRIGDIDTFGARLREAGLDVENFAKISEMRKVFESNRSYTAHDGERRTQRPTVSSENRLVDTINKTINSLSGNAPYISSGKSLLEEVKSHLESGNNTFAPSAQFLTTLNGLLELVNKSTNETTIKNTRRVLDALTDFIPAVSSLDSRILQIVSEGRFNGLVDIRRITTLINSESNALKKAWYQIQLQRLQLDVPQVKELYRFEQILRDARAFYPVDLVPEMKAVVEGTDSVFDLKDAEGNEFVSPARLKKYIATRLKASNSTLFGQAIDFELFFAVNPEVRGTQEETLLRAKRADIRSIRKAVRETGENVNVDSLSILIDSPRGFTIQEGGISTGRFYASQQVGTDQYHGVAVIGGELVLGKLNGKDFTPIQQTGQQASFNFDVFKRQVLVDELSTREGDNQDLIEAVRNDEGITLPDGTRVYKGKFIAQGGVGTVYRGVLMTPAGEVKMVVVKDVLQGRLSLETVLQTLAVNEHVSNTEMPHGIAKIYGVVRGQPPLMGTIITEFVDSGDKALEFKEVQFDSSMQADYFAKDTIRLLQDLHDRGLVVSDIKGENILVRNTGRFHEDGTPVLEPVIADLDSVLYRGEPADYPLGDPRRNFTLNSDGIKGILSSPLTSPGVKGIDEAADGTYDVTIIVGDPAAEKILIKNKDTDSESQLGGSRYDVGYEGFDAHALAWTLFFSIHGEKVTLNNNAQDTDYTTNFGDILSPELRNVYIKAVENALGIDTGREGIDTTKERIMLNADAKSVLSRMKTFIFGTPNNEAITAGKRTDYQLKSGQNLTIFAGETRVEIRRDGNNYLLVDSRTGAYYPLDLNKKTTFENIVIEPQTSGIFSGERVRVTNNSGVDARVRQKDAITQDSELITAPETRLSDSAQELLSMIPADQRQAVLEGLLQAGTFKDLSSLSDADQRQFVLDARTTIQEALTDVRNEGQPIALFGSLSLFNMSFSKQVPNDIDIATSPQGLVNLYQKLRSHPDIVIVGKPYLHASGTPFQALKLEAYYVKNGVVIPLEAFGEGGSFARYLTKQEGGGRAVVNRRPEKMDYNDGLFQLGDPNSADKKLKKGSAGQDLNLEAHIEAYEKVISLENKALDDLVSVSRAGEDAGEASRLVVKIEAREKRIEKLKQDFEEAIRTLSPEQQEAARKRLNSAIEKAQQTDESSILGNSEQEILNQDDPADFDDLGKSDPNSVEDAVESFQGALQNTGGELNLLESITKLINDVDGERIEELEDQVVTLENSRVWNHFLMGNAVYPSMGNPELRIQEIRVEQKSLLNPFVIDVLRALQQAL